MTSICCGAALVDALGDGCCCMRRLRYEMHVATASTATSRQPAPSERPMVRPGPASCDEGGDGDAGGSGDGDAGGSGDGGGGDGGGGEGARRTTWTWTSMTKGAAGGS